MATLREAQVQKVLRIIEAIKGAAANGDAENVTWNWGRAHSYAECLESCDVISSEEATLLQEQAIAATGNRGKKVYDTSEAI
ncbi:hypothetical protein NPS53_09560 [Pseudomonas putida]|uniref:hypothetical protein n=1 Tax=Pseudomonas putida TaxID=303 RepID=UPI002364A4ED|nr:hypothetical protein [Pseudomonas putida]MDD2139824.1 hypothetical protein [Pseudomonas putida]HDS1721748.1 hypothetical protein [Pseudomonas putida]